MCVYPVDVIKTNLQLHSGGEGGPTGMVSMTRYLYQKNGLGAFSKGLGGWLCIASLLLYFYWFTLHHIILNAGPTLLRAFPVNASVFFFYEELKVLVGM